METRASICLKLFYRKTEGEMSTHYSVENRLKLHANGVLASKF